MDTKGSTLGGASNAARSIFNARSSFVDDTTVARDDLVMASTAARQELAVFARATAPSPTSRFVGCRLVVVLILRPLVGRLIRPLCRASSSIEAALVLVGGIERVNLLLIVGRFDRDRSNHIDPDELRAYETAASAVIKNCVDGCGNTSVVAALMIGLAHLTNIGRPNSKQPQS